MVSYTISPALGNAFLIMHTKHLRSTADIAWCYNYPVETIRNAIIEARGDPALKVIRGGRSPFE